VVPAEETQKAGQQGAETTEAAKAFESLYGADFKRARATRDPKDDLELAMRLMAAAKESQNQPEFLAVLYGKAADLASPYPDGQATAVEAMRLLAAAVPEQSLACAERIVEICQRKFDATRGDERPKAGEALLDALLSLVGAQTAAGETAAAIGACRRAAAVARVISSPRRGSVDARLNALEQAVRAASEIEDLKKQLAQDPQNRAVREKLVRRLLVDLDSPAQAAKYVVGVEDPSLLKYVPAAAKPPDEVPELACLELAEWYRGLAEAAPPGTKAAMLARARPYYHRFLQLHAAQDLSRTQAALALKKIEESLAAAPQEKKAAARPALDEAHLGQILLAGLQRKVESSRKGGPPKDIQYKDHILETVEWKAAKGEVVHPAGNIVVGLFPRSSDKGESGAINVPAGFFLEGGEIFLEKGALRLQGTATEPVILKDVDLSAQSGDGVQARFTIFVNCKFSKRGGVIGERYTCKWTFNNCIIAMSNFRDLAQVDYGIKLTDCVFLGCTMPKRLLERKTWAHPNPTETGIAALYQDDWNQVTRCHFVDCVMAPSFVWATKTCDFTNCRIQGTDAFASTDSLAVQLHASPRDRQFLEQLTAGTTFSGTGRITFHNAPSPFTAGLPTPVEIGRE
jgi:hypothetical protein